MLKELTLHEGVIRRSLVEELESFRAPPDGRASSYYLNLCPQGQIDREVVRVYAKDVLKRERERIDQLDVSHAVRAALRRDWELVAELVPAVAGERHTRGLACFVAAEAGYGRAVPLSSPVRDRAFFDDRFVLWPLRQVLDQADRYAIILTNKDEGRLFLFFMERIAEISEVFDEVPGRVRFPDPLRQLHYAHKHVELFHHHFQHLAELGLRFYEREPFQHLIVGGLWEVLPQFEAHLHRYLRDRVVARWEIDVHTPLPQVLERAWVEEQRYLEHQARDVWQAIQDNRARLGALGPDEVFAALWQRRVQTLLVETGVAFAGYRCTVCGRLQRNAGPCVECGGQTAQVPDAVEEAVHDTIEQSALVRYWRGAPLHEVGSVAALKRF